MSNDFVSEGFPLKRITEGAKRGWRLALTWLEPGIPSSLLATHDSLGVDLVYGMLHDGQKPLYDVPLIREKGGGGSIFIPYAISPHGELFVGAIYEKRLNMGTEPVLCVIGGFNNPGVSHRDTLVAEAAEEASISANKAIEVQGLPINPNRAFFVANASNGEGVHAYALEIPWKELSLGESGHRHLSPKSHALVDPHNPKAKSATFFPHDELVLLTPDGLLLAALCRLRVQIGL